MRTEYEDIVDVTCENNGKVVKADVLEFSPLKRLAVAINKSVKLTLSWNGKIYEGKMSGMSFISTGPKATTYKQGR